MAVNKDYIKRQSKGKSNGGQFAPDQSGIKAPTASSLSVKSKSNADASEIEYPPFIIPEYKNADLASAPEVTQDELIQLIKYGNDKVRMRVAGNIDISREAFDLLARDTNLDVLDCLASNENLPTDLFRVLMERVENARTLFFTPNADYSPGYVAGGQPLGEYVIGSERKALFVERLLTGRHKYFDDPILLEQFTKYPSEEIRMDVMRHPKITRSILESMATDDPRRSVRKEAKALLRHSSVSSLSN